MTHALAEVRFIEEPIPLVPYDIISRDFTDRLAVAFTEVERVFGIIGLGLRERMIERNYDSDTDTD